MSSTTPAYAAPGAGEPLIPTTIERRDVGANDVLIDIEYAGSPTSSTPEPLPRRSAHT
jgi:D-arabinose 1-dehydrogenase-like Zn-dependent alcohol dehydrogenase